MNDIDRILGELYEIDPSLAKHEDILRRIIPTLLAAKPQLSVDDAFVARLRSELMHLHASRTISRFAPTLSPFFSRNFAVVAIALVVVVGGVLAVSTMDDHRGTLAINTISTRAFGSLAQTAPATIGGKNAGPEADTRAGSIAAFSAPVGLGGGSGAAAGFAPTYPAMTSTQYVYRGESFTIPSSGFVYKRITDEATGSRLVSALRGMNFGVAIGSFSDVRVRNIEIAEDKDYGYSINLSIPLGMVSINANWEKWHMDTRVGAPIAANEMPSNEALIAIADQFLQAHRISTAAYGEPIVDEGWRAMPAVTTLDGRTMPSYAPDTIMITYPFMIDGMPVYENWGVPSGLQILVDIHESRVSSVNNLTTLSYDRSEYALETDSQKIKDLATTGGTYLIKKGLPQPGSGVITQALGTPTLVLMKYYRNASSRNEELLIPAMRFPMQEPQPGSGPGYVMVPLVKDIVDSLIVPNEVTNGGREGTGTVCTMEVKQCADGSYVGRVGPTCSFAACPGETETPPTMLVSIGKSATLSGVTIKPTEVLEDSRCPIDAACIQAGTVRVATSLTSGMGTAPQTFTLDKPITTEAEQITLISVTPLKKVDVTIPASDYTFIFEVRKR